MNHSMRTLIFQLKTAIGPANVLLAGVVLFAGCSFAPKYSEPSVQTPAAFKEMTPAQASETDGWKTAQPDDDRLSSRFELGKERFH